MALIKKMIIPLFILMLGALATSITWQALNPQSPIEQVTAPQKIEVLNLEGYTLPPIYIEQWSHIPYKKSLSTVLIKEGFTPKDVYKAARTLNKFYNLKRLPAEAKFTVTFKEPMATKRPILSSLSIFTKNDRHIIVTRKENGTYKAQIQERPIQKILAPAQGVIHSSLYLAAQKAGLPDQLIAPFIELFSWDIDFTRDIRKGDSFKIVFEKILDEQGEFIRYGNIVAGNMSLRRLKKDVSAFRAENNKYYNAKGQAKKKALLRTPLKFSRISSHFNPRRKHPVLGYTRAHRGTDFAARTGTPIRAAGDGRIVFKGWKGGYGRYIKIKHSKDFSTAYAHLSRYKSRLKKGKSVKQGDIIGYVGMSGTATGPHLHYEVLRHGRQVNALKVRLPQGKPLPKKLHSSFKKQVALATTLWKQHLASNKSTTIQAN